MTRDPLVALRKSETPRSGPFPPDRESQSSRGSFCDSPLRDIPVNEFSFPCFNLSLTLIQNVFVPLWDWHGVLPTEIVPERFHRPQLLFESHLINIEDCGHKPYIIRFAA